MEAALITGKETVELRTFPDPTPPEKGVVVDIAFCGICGTDVHAYQSGTPYNPAICGHEWVGTVSAADRAVRRIAEGDRVVVAAPPPCGDCDPCRSGRPDTCSLVFAVVVGRDRLAPAHGGFAPRVAVGADRVVKADPALSDEQAAQVEPATVAFHAVRRSGLRLGDLAVVQGAGPIGLTTLQWAIAGGAREVIVVEPNDARRALAGRLGAAITTTPGEVADVVAERTSGLGADVVYECVGRPEAIQGAVDIARRGGSVSIIGLSDREATVVPAAWLVKEINVSGSLAYAHEEFEMAMGMIADGRLLVDEMHTLTAGLAGLDEALRGLASGAGGQTKVLVNPNW